MFEVQHQVQFYETDLMGIVHHSNYLLFCEEARVAWAHFHGLLDYQKPGSAHQLAVLGTQVRHLKALKFGDLVRIQVQARRKGIRIIFEYRILLGETLVVEARTEHAALSTDLKPIKLPSDMQTILEKEQWIETWLLNL
ncbi:MAG: acyl-CoA thioesterase [Proteobacteria bacterium]|nr:acyl-CoA thioesterase [Pseudomonadota bacterium]